MLGPGPGPGPGDETDKGCRRSSTALSAERNDDASAVAKQSKRTTDPENMSFQPSSLTAICCDCSYLIKFPICHIADSTL